MKKLMMAAIAAMGLAFGAQAGVSYLEPVFDSTGAVSGYETKTIDSYREKSGGVSGNEDFKQSDSEWFVITGDYNVPDRLRIKGNVKIILCNGKKLTAGRVEVKGSDSLTIYAQSEVEGTMGQLIADKKDKEKNKAGIGGDLDGDSGTITINGGKITANGGYHGAGIGGGGSSKGKNITINGGIVTAEGGANAAGIGGGNGDDGDTITINGGIVTATGGEGAGIGGGHGGKGLNITINGGTVTADGGYDGAGIGSGYDDYCDGITINGGTVTATGRKNCAGIGGGKKGQGRNITINGGTVTATGDEGAAGIGGGMNAGCTNIVITGGTVKAQGGIKGGAGIGGGFDGQAHGITIKGGRVRAIAGGSYDATSDTPPTDSWGNIRRGMDIGAGGQEISDGKIEASDLIHYTPKTTVGRWVQRGVKLAGHIVGIVRKIKEFRYTIGIRIEGGTVEALMIGGDCDDDEGSKRKQVVVTGGSLINVSSSNGLYDDSGNELHCVDFEEEMNSPANLSIPNYGTNDLYPRTEGGEKTLYLWLPDGWKNSVTFNGNPYQMAVTVINQGTDDEDVVYTLTRVTVNNQSVLDGSGDGWTYNPGTGVLTLSKAMNYTLSGSDNGRLRVEVTANANVTLDNLTLPLTRQDGQTIQFKGGTTSSLILTGVNTVYGRGTHAAVLVGSGANVTLSGTGELVGNHANSRGLQVDNGGTLVMNGGTICDYSISIGGGGVVISNGGAFTMNGGTISDCCSTSNGGGAIYNDGTLTINGGTINGCSASNCGGAIYNAGTLTINGGTINGCSTSTDYWGGGALFNEGTASIYGGTFTGNSAPAGYGGCIYCNQGHAVSIYGGYFANNTAPAGRCNLYVGYCYEKNGKLYGGVFAADPLSTAESNNCLVQQSIEQGTVEVTKVGNFYVVGTGVQSQNGELTAGTYTFYPRNLEYVNAGLDVLDICTVTEQSTTPRTYVVTPPIDAAFSVNGTRVKDGPGTGWSFDYAKNTLVLSNDMEYVLSGYCNESYAVDVTTNATITLSDVRIHAGELEREVFNITGANVTLTLGGSNEVYTTSGYAAFGIASGAKLKMNGEGSLWGGSSADGNGRCVTVAEGGAFEMTAGAICDYYAEDDGGAIYNAGEVTIKGGMIVDNQTGGNGGALYNEGAVEIYGGTFEDNWAFSTDSRGGFCYCAAEGRTYIYGGSFAGNMAMRVKQDILLRLIPFYCLYYGEAPNGFLYGGVFDEDPCDPFKATEQSNLVLRGGATVEQVGALYVVGKGVESERSQLTGGTYWFDPTADEYAAAGLVCASYSTSVPQGTDPETYAVQKLAEFRVNGVKLVDCKGEGWSVIQEGATAGRVILSNATDYVLTGYADLTLTVDVLTNATVTLDGIRIRADKPQRDIFRVFGDDTVFILSGTNAVYANDGNAAIGVTAGARLKVEGCRLNDGISDCLVGGRTSGIDGRCFNVSGELVLESGTIRDYYTAEPQRGAGAYVAAAGVFTLNGGSITNNASSGFGGGICNYGTFEMNGGAIIGNVAQQHDGGAIWNGGSVVINDGVIANNTARFFGGAVLNGDGTFTLNGGELTGNAIVTHDDWFGGTVFGVYGGDVVVNGGWIHDNNTANEYAISVHQDAAASDATVKVYGGVFEEGKYFFRYGSLGTLRIFGCECSSYPGYEFVVSGYDLQSIGAAKPGWYAVGKNGTVGCTADGLREGGTFTFNPADDLYAEVGVSIAPQRIVTALGTNPETYRVDWNNTGLTINGVDAIQGIESGRDWRFYVSTGLVTLNAKRDDENPYVISGQNTRKDLDLGVAVDANGAWVELSDATISTTAKPAIEINATDVKLIVANSTTNILTAPSGVAALSCPAGKSVTIKMPDGGNDTYYFDELLTKLTASSIGGEGDVVIGRENYWWHGTGGNITVKDGIDVGNLTVHGGFVTAGSIYGENTVTLQGGTVVADTIEAGATLDIHGGSVKAGKVTNPISTTSDNQPVWCVTVPAVSNEINNISFYSYCSYDTQGMYPIDNALYIWLPNSDEDYPWEFEIEDLPLYYAVVANAPTVAYHRYDEAIELYVNGVQVTEDGGNGWTYENIGDWEEDWVLTLSPSDDTTNSYVITGSEMMGRVRIVVAGSCDVSFTGQLGYDPEYDDYAHGHLFVINEDVAVNLTFSDTTAFNPYPEYEPVCVKSGATANILGSGLVYGFNVKIEGTGKIVMENPTTLTYTTKAGADKAAATIQPIASEEYFPGIDQAAYATRVKPVVVERTGTDTWTLDYQISAQGTNDIVNVISSVEASSSIISTITNATPSATFYPVPGFYYGLPGATEVGNVEGASVPMWYRGQQDQELTVEGPTFTDTDKAFLQLRATLKP